MNGVEVNEPKPWPLRKKLKVALMVFTCIIGGTFVWFKMTYPYGASHCCSAGIGLSLRQYAMEHEGWLPHGLSTPEASFSLLETNGPPMLEWLRGKNIPLTVAKLAWERDGHLGPESCGWHYIEGLRDDDDPTIAVVWDKAWGLGHNGQRIRGFARAIVLLDGSHSGKMLKDWPQFATEQREKIAKVIASRPSGNPPIRWSDEETLGTNWFSAPKQK